MNPHHFRDVLYLNPDSLWWGYLIPHYYFVTGLCKLTEDVSHIQTHQLPKAQSRRCPRVLCLCGCPSRSPAELLRRVCPLSLGHTSMQTWSRMPPCSLSLDLPFAAQCKKKKISSFNHDINNCQNVKNRHTVVQWAIPDQTPGGRCCVPSLWCPSQCLWGSPHTPEPHLSSTMLRMTALLHGQ